MANSIATIICSFIFTIIFLLSNKSLGNPLRLSARGSRALAILALFVGVGIYVVATHFNMACDQSGCFIHWGNLLTN